MNKLSIHWQSNAPFSSTGYGNQTAVFTPRLKELGHDVSITATYGLEGGVINWQGIPIFPRAYHPYGQDIAPSHAMTVKADFLLTLLDSWVFDPRAFGAVKWIPWFPVDMHPLPPPIRKVVSQAFARIVYSKFACKEMEDAGLDYYYIPHGVETQVYKPMDMAQARATTMLPADAFIVGMVAANKGVPSRKAFAQNIEAFAMLRRKHNDAILYLHTSEGYDAQSFNLPEYCKFLGLEMGKDVLMCDPYQYMLGFPFPFMNALYNSMDVHLLVSMGEGFGIPIVEAQAAGCPVIVGDWTAMPELCFSGWKVAKEDAQQVWTPLAAYQYSPNPHAIYERLEAAYNMRGNMDYRKRARDGALQYDADKVVEKYWKPVLDALYKRIKEPEVEVMQPIKFVE